MIKGRNIPVFSSDTPSWFVDEPREKVFEILKRSSQTNNGVCCIRPGSKPNTFALTSRINGETKNYVIREEHKRYKLILKNEQPWVSSLEEILQYFLSVSKNVTPLNQKPSTPTDYDEIPVRQPHHSGYANMQVYQPLESTNEPTPEYTSLTHPSPPM